MRTLVRNRQVFQYRNYIGETDTLDDDGDYTGVPLVEYSAPVTHTGSISPASGYSQAEQFGTLEGYDKVIVTDKDLPITETSVINIEHLITEADEPHDYIVRRIAKSLNYMSIAIKKVV